MCFAIHQIIFAAKEEKETKRNSLQIGEWRKMSDTQTKMMAMGLTVQYHNDELI